MHDHFLDGSSIGSMLKLILELEAGGVEAATDLPNSRGRCCSSEFSSGSKPR